MFSASGRHARIAATAATDETFTTAVHIAGANKIALEVPTFAVGLATDSCNVYAQVANTSTTGEFVRLKDMGAYSASSGIQDWEVPSGIGQYIVLCRPAVGFDYVRFEFAQGSTFNATATAALSCYVHVIN